MKAQLTVDELRDFCKRNQFSQIVYYTGNQECTTVPGPCSVLLYFRTMFVSEQTRQVCLRNERDTLQFSRVCAAQVDTEHPLIGTIITIFCKSIDPLMPEIAYTLYAS